MAGPLAGFRVVDLSMMLSGPWAADILGDQGADVIKVEVPGVGDYTRLLRNRSGGLSSMFVNINRSKRSITLNLKDPAGIGVLKKMVETADVLVQNFRPGVVGRLGIGWEDLRLVRPELVYLSITGFGPEGPYAQRRVYDPVVQALSGLTAIQGGGDALRPRLIRTVLPDKLSAVAASQAVTAALLARERTGERQHVEISMLDTVLSFLWASDMGAYTFMDKPTQPEAAASFIDLIYETADGYMTVSVMSDREWKAFCLAVGKPEHLEDERFATPEARDENVNERLELIQSELLARTRDEWLEIFHEHDVPCAPALTRAEVIEHPQVLASDVLIETEHPAAGRLRQTRTPAKWRDTVPDPPRGAPLLGEHNEEVLAEIGYDEEEIRGFRERGVIGSEIHGVEA